MAYDDPAGLGILPGTTDQVDAGSAWPIAGDYGMALGTGTGQHGVTPLPNGGSGFMGGIVSFWNWINRPFTQPMNASTLFFAVGVVIIAILAWNLILYHVRIAAESI